MTLKRGRSEPPQFNGHFYSAEKPLLGVFYDYQAQALPDLPKEFELEALRLMESDWPAASAQRAGR